MGGGSGGGGGSGKVEYPAYMEAMHSAWLIAVNGEIATSVNPYLGYSAYDPDSETVAMVDAIEDLLDYLDSLASVTSIDAAIVAFSNILQKELDNTAVPAFEAGMRSINAVQTSAFVVGKAMLMGKKLDAVAKYTSDLDIDLKVRLAAEYRQSYIALSEAYRMKLIANKEEYDQQMETEVLYAKWPLERYSYGADMLSSIGGGHSGGPASSKPNKAQSAIGGAMSGAALGTSIMPGYGTAAGAVLGGIAGYIGS